MKREERSDKSRALFFQMVFLRRNQKVHTQILDSKMGSEFRLSSP